MPHIGRHILGRASNKTKRDLENELWNLSKRITNQEQFELYTNRVSQLRGLQENLRYIRSRELLELVRQLKDRVDLLTLDQTLVSHDACKDIIKEEFRRLNQLKEQSASDVADDATMEAEAIRKDRKALEDLLKQINTDTIRTQSPRILTLHSMDDRESAPITITHGYTSYSDLVWHLSKQHQISAAIWIRRTGAHQWSPSGIKWMRAKYKDDIRENILDYLNIKGRPCYIVVLVSENGKDFPEALDIKQVGEECCSPGHCGTLRGHLNRIWPNRIVECAHKLHEPNEASNVILGRAFDTEDLEEFTHQLCFKSSPRS